MKFKCIQTFSPEYLRQCQLMNFDEILQFLDDFSQLNSSSLNPVSKQPQVMDFVVADPVYSNSISKPD